MSKIESKRQRDDEAPAGEGQVHTVVIPPDRRHIFAKIILNIDESKRVEMLTPEKARDLINDKKYLMRAYIELGITELGWICHYCEDVYSNDTMECAPCAQWYFHERSLSAYERERIFRLAKNQCWYCGTSLTGVATIDHQKARARGGGHQPENLVAACKRCNFQKGKRSVSEYREYLEHKTGQPVVFYVETLTKREAG